LVEITRAQEYQPGNLMYVAGEARALAALGRTEALFRLLEASQSKRWVIGEPAAVMEQAARELRRHGFPQQSLAVAVRGIEWLRARPPSEWRGSHRPALARMFYLAERWDEAQSAFERLALESPDSVDYAGYLGAIAARQKDVARAVAASEKLRRLSSADLFGRHTFWRACIASLLGERERAVSLLRDSFGQGQYQGLRVHQAPEFESIWSFPPFIELLKPRE
jgi:predicted Zn-dependent protease